MDVLLQTETLVAVIVLLAMMFLATVDLAFSYLSDVGLRRISSDDESHGGTRKSSIGFLREILDNRPRFRFAISSTIQVLLVLFTVLLTMILSQVTTSRVGWSAATLTIALVTTVLLRQIVPRMLVHKDP